MIQQALKQDLISQFISQFNIIEIRMVHPTGFRRPDGCELTQQTNCIVYNIICYTSDNHEFETYVSGLALDNLLKKLNQSMVMIIEQEG